MCGRYALVRGLEEIDNQFNATSSGIGSLPYDWNITPTQNVFFIKSDQPDGAQRKIEIGVWGLIPHWAKNSSLAANSINARVETIDQKPSFKSSFRSRRCLIPADGYYEWATEHGRYKPKQPFFISNSNKSFLAMAGIYEEWLNPLTNKIVISTSIITRESTGFIAKIHHRMPIILPQDRWNTWLEGRTLSEREVTGYLTLLESDDPCSGLTAWAVSPAINSGRASGSELAREVELGEPETLF